MNGIMVWAWMLWLSYSLKDERNYGLGMDAYRTHQNMKRNYGLGMDVLVIVFIIR